MLHIPSITATCGILTPIPRTWAGLVHSRSTRLPSYSMRYPSGVRWAYPDGFCIGTVSYRRSASEVADDKQCGINHQSGRAAA